MAREDLPQWLQLSCEAIYPVGSRVVCNPPPMDTDEDWLCLLNPLIESSIVHSLLEAGGWVSSGYENSPWHSFKKGELNLLVTKDKEHVTLFMRITKLAKKKNLLVKEERVALYNKLLKKPKEKKTHSKISLPPFIWSTITTPPSTAQIHQMFFTTF